MTFALPQLLWLLALPLALLAWEVARDRRLGQAGHPKILQGRAGRSDFELLPAQAGNFGRARPRLWLCLGLVLATAALARPQYGRIEEQVFDQSREIMLAVDLSRSMLADDVKPTRLGRAKLLIQSLLERLEGERVGLVLFAGTSFVQSPLSSDYEILNEFLPVLEPGYLPAGGSNYGALLRAATEAFGSTATADRFLIILSDGEATDETWRDEIPALKAKGIRVLGLGVGTTAGSMIPDGSGGFVKDERGAVVMSKLENATLQELATQTAGTYEDASGWVDLAQLLQQTVEAGRQGTFMQETRVRLAERFQWVLAPALLCLLISYWREFPARPKPRELRLVSTPAPDPARSAAPEVTAVLLILLALGTGATPARSATLDPRQAATAAPVPVGEVPVEDPGAIAAAPLSQAVGRLSRQSRHAASDWAEIARLTITFGNQLLSANLQVPEGPVRDALQAVELGAGLDAKAADWPELRKQLEELLRKSDEPPPEEPPPPPPEDQKQEKQESEGKSGEGEPKEGEQNGSGQPQKQDGQTPKEGEPPPEQDKEDAKNNEQKDDAQSAFGDMNEEGQPDDQEPQDQPPPKDQTQQVGGNASNQPPRNTDPSLTIPLQHLDELRDKDNPSDLFQLMDDQPAPKSPGKDW